MKKQVEVCERVGYSKGNKILVRCICHCGKEFITRKESVASGNTKSCGCLHATRNNMCKINHTFVRAWSQINYRCSNEKSSDFKYYGGRGICVEWNSFNDFYNDMFSSWKSSLTIERVDNSKNYSKENCKWATRKEQMNNMRRNVFITTNTGIRKTQQQWADELKINKTTLSRWIKKGITIDSLVNNQ